MTQTVGGGYSIHTPGQGTTVVTRSIGGGYTVYTPAQEVTIIVPPSRPGARRPPR